MEQQRFIALIANASPALVGVELIPGTVIKRRPMAEMLRVLPQASDIHEHELASLLQDHFFCTTDDGRWVYVADGIYTPPPPVPNDVLSSMRAHELHAGRVLLAIQALHLFADGNVQAPAWHFFTKDGSRWEPDHWSHGYERVPYAPYAIDRPARRELRRFLASTSLPPGPGYMRTAWEMFEASFDHYDSSIGFLLLVIALECLFNDGGAELKYRIARSAAVLLGETQDESHRVYEEVRRAYDRRSGLVHRGARADISQDDNRGLRAIVRRLLRLLMRSSCEKQDVLLIATQASFGNAAGVARELCRKR